MKRGLKTLLLAIACCLSIQALVELLFGDGTWPQFAFSFLNACFYMTVVLCVVGSIASIVTLSLEKLRLRVGFTYPCSILILSSFLAGATAFHSAIYRQAQSRPIKIEIGGPDEYRIDGVHATRGQTEQALRARWHKYGCYMPVHFRACPSTVFSQAESLLWPFWKINIGLVGDKDLLPAMFSPLPDDIVGPPVNVVHVYASATNLRGINLAADGMRLDTKPVLPTSFAQAFLPPPTNGLDYRVILYCASNTTFSIISEVVKQCGHKGLDTVFFQDDHSIRHMQGDETETYTSSSNTASEATLKTAPTGLASPH